MNLEQRLRQGPLKVRDVWSQDHAARLSAGVLRLRRRRSMTRAGLAASALLCVGGLLFVRAAQQPAPQAATTHPVVIAAAPAAPAAPAPDVLTLHDGSRAEPADPSSRVTVLSNRPDHVRLRVQQGGARFDVVHNPARAFEVESGPVLVRVAGTIFSVTRTDDGAHVAVERGRVHVFWAGQSTDLVAGESRMFPPPAPLGAPAAETARARKSEPPSDALGWRDLAQRGEYKQAYSALHHARVHVQDAPEDLMLAADVARLSGHPEQAVAQLREVSERFAGDPRAPVAAFTLGGVLLHDLEQPRAAAAAFHRARTLWSQGPLALDAWASEAEALHAAGDDGAAARLAVRYLALHPEGRHAHAMQALAAAE